MQIHLQHGVETLARTHADKNTTLSVDESVFECVVTLKSRQRGQHTEATVVMSRQLAALLRDELNELVCLPKPDDWAEPEPAMHEHADATVGDM